jgi:hypothetical protein
VPSSTPSKDLEESGHSLQTERGALAAQQGKGTEASDVGNALTSLRGVRVRQQVVVHALRVGKRLDAVGRDVAAGRDGAAATEQEGRWSEPRV